MITKFNEFLLILESHFVDEPVRFTRMISTPTTLTDKNENDHKWVFDLRTKEYYCKVCNTKRWKVKNRPDGHFFYKYETPTGIVIDKPNDKPPDCIKKEKEFHPSFKDRPSIFRNKLPDDVRDLMILKKNISNSFKTLRYEKFNLTRTKEGYEKYQKLLKKLKEDELFYQEMRELLMIKYKDGDGDFYNMIKGPGAELFTNLDLTTRKYKN